MPIKILSLWEQCLILVLEMPQYHDYGGNATISYWNTGL